MNEDRVYRDILEEYIAGLLPPVQEAWKTVIRDRIHAGCPDLKLPRDVHISAGLAHQVIMEVLKEHGAVHTGGCRAFYSPAEWRERGEEYARKCELVVVYDGGDLGKFFHMGAVGYEQMVEALASVGLYAEEATCWYSGIYKK